MKIFHIKVKEKKVNEKKIAKYVVLRILMHTNLHQSLSIFIVSIRSDYRGQKKKEEKKEKEEGEIKVI